MNDPAMAAAALALILRGQAYKLDPENEERLRIHKENKQAEYDRVTEELRKLGLGKNRTTPAKG
jgi:hypothetical protein